ncbi:HIT family protein [Enterococcus sp. BWM-S5]|uniref:HIT family protein n=1 Tax=Enterococcus larvae TaxID=2794352 RepID=A0ABS4CJZ1_9ENTE|nr:HIT family protein [Enterococcus larvae]MBP1046881.1 HIT family protein [Enterococcus larvae]
MLACLFCDRDEFIFENELAGAFLDKYPVSEGHLLIIPKQHRVDFFELTMAEKAAIDKLLIEGKAYLEKLYQPDGFNIGCNCGVVSGQSVMHCHIHLIPRYKGDTAQPKGGVRGVIPEKQRY